MVYAVITHACLYDCKSYEVGDELTSHDVADKLVLFGVAARPGDIAGAHTEDAQGVAPAESEPAAPAAAAPTGRKAKPEGA